MENFKQQQKQIKMVALVCSAVVMSIRVCWCQKFFYPYKTPFGICFKRGFLLTKKIINNYLIHTIMKKETLYTPSSRFRRLFRTKTTNAKLLSNELIHPRFVLTETDLLTKTKTVNSLLFLMYSQENESLFI